MALLAYDPERVGRLRQKLAEASIELRMVRCTDPAAADAMRIVRSTVEQLDATWLPLVGRLLDNDPLSGRLRKVLGLNSLDQSLIRVMADGYGWSVHHDPLADDTAIVTVEEARALGAMLNSVGPVALADDPEQLAWLAQQFDVIARDPALSEEFLANFHNWDVLPYVLAQQRAYSYDRDYAGTTFAGDIDPVFDGLMAIWMTTLPVATLRAGTAASITDLLPPMDNRDRYVQALMLHALRLDPIAMATVANDLLHDWLDAKETFGTSIDLEVAFGPNAADLLLQDIACSSAASTAFLALIVDRPALLFATLADPIIGHQIARTGTDPAHTSSAAAGRSVLSILDYFGTNPYTTSLDTDGYPGDYGPFLGELVAPWLLQFTGANDEWAASDRTKARLLAVALDDAESLHALVAASHRIADGFAHTLATSSNDDEAVQLSRQVGGLLNLLGQLVVNEHIDDRNGQSNVLWDLTWTVLDATTSLVPGGAAAEAVAGTGVSTLEEQLAVHFFGPNADAVRHDGEFSMDMALTVTASVMVTSLFHSWQEAGRINSDATPPPLPTTTTTNTNNTAEGCPSADYRDDLERWADNLPAELGGAALNVADNFISRGQSDEHCAELTHT